MQNNLKELIKEIEKNAKIEEIVSNYIHLEKKGNNFIGLCPFHTDSNPSMSVSPSKGIFKCFSCGAGGNVINFIQNYKGISFIEALKEIADYLKIDWKNFINDNQNKKIDPILQKIWEINKEALNFFKYSLNSNSDALEYLKNRDVKDEVIQEFEIGWSGEREELINFLIKKGFEDSEIIKSGLGKIYDKKIMPYFIKRIMFPIHDKNGNVAGFSGRNIENSKYAKYLNSPETIAFKKNEILYNFHRAQSPVSLKKQAIIVEGFMDVIAYWKSGIKNVLATMGTSFTQKHTFEIKKMTNEIILSFDKDLPGINALIKTAKEIMSSQLKVKVSFPKEGKDIDEYLKLTSTDDIKKNISEATDFISFYVEQLFKKVSKEEPDFEKIREVLRIIILNDDEIKMNFYVNKISDYYKIDRDILLKQSSSLIKNNKQISKNHIKPLSDENEYIEQMYSSADFTNDIQENKNKLQGPFVKFLDEELRIISLLLVESSDVLNVIKKTHYIFSNEAAKKCHKEIMFLIEKHGNLSYEEIINKITDQKITTLLIKLKIEKPNNVIEEVLQLINNLKDKQIIIKKRLLVEEIKKESNIDKKKFLQKTLINLN